MVLRQNSANVLKAVSSFHAELRAAGQSFTEHMNDMQHR